MVKKKKNTEYLKMGVLIGVISLFLLTWFIWPYIAYSNVERDFFGKIKTAVAEGKTEIVIADITNFEWDTVCFYDYGSDFFYNFDNQETFPISKISSGKNLKKLNSVKEKSDIALFVFALKKETVEVLYRYSNVLNIENNRHGIVGGGCLNSKQAILSFDKNITFTKPSNGEN